RQAELRRRLSSLGEMAAGLAHELRNSMAVIAGYAKLLVRADRPAGDHPGGRSPGQSGTEQSRGWSGGKKAAARAIGKEVSAMNSIINGFLSFANPATPALEAVSREGLLGILKTCMNAVLAGDGARRISASLSSDAGRSVIKADEILLKQAFMNLIQNAVQAMPGGGELAVRVEERQGQALISISDTGPGIPEEMRQRIFLPFYTTREGGTGLGLAVVHGIISSHSGSIELGKGPRETGSEFLIRLPLNDQMDDRTPLDGPDGQGPTP
nr:ATP-binding protein [Nitrospiraceae bacterium]